MHLLGTIQAIHRYPVKSMAGESLPTATVGWHGLDGDRRFAFRRLGDASGFPWLSAGKLPALVRHRAYYPDQAAPGAHVRVVTPDGRDLAGDSDELLARLTAAFGGALELHYLTHGIHDEAPLALITTATLRHLSEAGGVAADARRFRPNLLIHAVDDRPFAEDAWVGRSLALGDRSESPRLAVTQRDLRCAMVNLDPDTAASEPRVLKTAAQLNDACAGVYAVPTRTGQVAVGDALYALA